VKNRVHLDVPVGEDNNVDAEVQRLVAAGATVLHHGRQGPHTWVTIADPEGNELPARIPPESCSGARSLADIAAPLLHGRGRDGRRGRRSERSL
jgi:hypothetical protein